MILTNKLNIMKHIKYIIFFILIFTNTEIWAQCVAIYDAGIQSMQKHKYNEAIQYFRSAMACDKSMESQCNTKIKECQRILNKKANQVEEKFIPELAIREKSFHFAHNDEKIEYIHVEKSSPINYHASSTTPWITLQEYHNNTISVKCDKNTGISERNAVIYIGNGHLIDSIDVKQDGTPEYLDATPKELMFFKKGGEMQTITVNGNGEWEIASKPDWIEAHITQDGKIIVSASQAKSKRHGIITIKSKSNKFYIPLQVIQESKLNKLFNKEGKEKEEEE